jgi:hypothetical protein
VTAEPNKSGDCQCDCNHQKDDAFVSSDGQV